MFITVKMYVVASSVPYFFTIVLSATTKISMLRFWAILVGEKDARLTRDSFSATPLPATKPIT